MHVLVIIGALIFIFGVLLDAFETIVLPRRVRRQFRLTAWFYRYTWRPWRRITSRIKSNSRRENFLGYFGPLSLILLLVVWAGGLIFGMALLQYGFGHHVSLNNERITFWTLLYLSGETFFTLGLGDVLPAATSSRILTVVEGGMGFAFLGVVIGYIPTIYSAFSRREIEISLLDARAGSPPTAAELLARFGGCPDQTVLDKIFRDWEHWAAEVLESHLSYPALSFFRSQHSNQSWLGALTTVLDASALVIAGLESVRNEQAKITFAMARHAVVDLAQVVNARYDPEVPDRLPPAELGRLRQHLSQRGLRLKEGPEFEQKLTHLRAMYEPYAHAMGRNLVIALPPWVHLEKKKDNWQAGPWDRAIQARSLSVRVQSMEDHF
ncbi:MAG: two pore domain potassium channel family protein [Acidobacteriales bacterium]|nr:two pore domain potassium channel family protein [Terriglobales bacterium]